MKRAFFLTWLLFIALARTSMCADGYSDFYSSHLREGYNDGYRSTTVWWKNWVIRSSEELYERKSAKVDFPLTNLFDNDPRTTWADGNPRRTLRSQSPWRTRFALNVQAQNSARIDELWIMNGDNRSRDLFKRNDRIAEMQIWINDIKVKTVRIFDHMGWHKIKLPPNNFHSVGLLFTGIRKGAGPDNNVCVSELALRYEGRKIDMKLPQLVFFEDGNESGDAPRDCALIASRGGEVVTHGTAYSYNDHPEAWSPRGKFVSGIWQIKNKSRSSADSKNLFWIADVNQQKIVRRALLPDQKNDKGCLKELAWLDEKTVEVRWIDSNYNGEAIKETIEFRKQYKIE